MHSRVKKTCMCNPIPAFPSSVSAKCLFWCFYAAIKRWQRQTMTCMNHTVKGFCANARTAMTLSLEISWRSIKPNSTHRSQPLHSTLVNTLIFAAFHKLLALCVTKKWFVMHFPAECFPLHLLFTHHCNLPPLKYCCGSHFHHVSQVKCKMCNKKMERRHLLDHEVNI